MTAESWYVPINPATKKAKELYLKIAIQRNGILEELKNKKWSTWLQCCRCSMRGNKKKYRSSEMLHILSKARRKESGKTEIHWRHYCPECQKDYKPNSKTAGGLNM